MCAVIINFGGSQIIISPCACLSVCLPESSEEEEEEEEEEEGEQKAEVHVHVYTCI